MKDISQKYFHQNEIGNICNQIKNRNIENNKGLIIENMIELVREPFYPNISLEEFDKIMKEIYNIFERNPNFKEINDIWIIYPWLKPRHLISILAQFPISIEMRY